MGKTLVGVSGLFGRRAVHRAIARGNDRLSLGRGITCVLSPVTVIDSLRSLTMTITRDRALLLSSPPVGMSKRARSDDSDK